MDETIELNAKVFGRINRLCLSPIEAAVLGYVTTFTVFGQGFYAGREALAAECRCSVSATSRAIRALKARGLIHTGAKLKNHSTTTYVATQLVIDLISKPSNNDKDESSDRLEVDSTKSDSKDLFAWLFSRVNRMCKSPIEVLVLGYVATFTAFGKGFYAGQHLLADVCRCSEDTIQRAIDSLKGRGLIAVGAKKKNYTTTTYVATACVLNQINKALRDLSEEADYGSEKVDLRLKKEEAKKQNPSISPQGDFERKPRKSGSRAKKRALNYIRGTEKYDKESLRKMGISMGEEFYTDDYEK